MIFFVIVSLLAVYCSQQAVKFADMFNSRIRTPLSCKRVHDTEGSAALIVPTCFWICSFLKFKPTDLVTFTLTFDFSGITRIFFDIQVSLSYSALNIQVFLYY